MSAMSELIAALEARATAAEDREAKLREALERVCAVRVDRDDNIWAGANKCCAIARAALETDNA